MASIKVIRKRIISVKKTQQITKAMKMIAAVKFRKARESLLSLRPYAATLSKVLRSVAQRCDPQNHGCHVGELTFDDIITVITRKFKHKTGHLLLTLWE